MKKEPTLEQKMAKLEEDGDPLVVGDENPLPTLKFSYSEDSKASSTATTPMESSRKIKFNHDGNTPPGHQTGASWEAYARKKRNREDEDDGSGGIDA